MVYFFGIFGPHGTDRHPAAKVSGKVNFFGGLPDAAQWAVPLSRAEQDACYRNGKGSEPDRARADPQRDGYAEPGPSTAG